MFDYQGKVVLITGGGAGIGAACAKAFAARGGVAAVNSVTDSGKKVVKEIEEEGGKAFFVQGDVSRETDVAAMMDKVKECCGRLDVLVNCAGVVENGNVEETSLKAWERTMAVNATGVFLMSKYAMPYLRNSQGVIVNISSLVAIKGVANRAAYSASKGAVLALTKAMAADYLKDGVRVNCISPGTVLSPSLEGRMAGAADPEEAYRGFVARQPMGRLGTPEEIAAAVIFAASEEAGFMNGVNIPVDGAGSL